MGTMDCFSATKAADATAYNGQYCLAANSWTSGQCCATDATAFAGLCAEAPQSAAGAVTKGKAFCGTKALISNKFLREFLMPANTEYCPTTYEITQVNEN